MINNYSNSNSKIEESKGNRIPNFIEEEKEFSNSSSYFSDEEEYYENGESELDGNDSHKINVLVNNQ